MRRPALALFVFLGAGWGLAASAQVANALPPFVGGTATPPARPAGGGAVPDTVAPWRYYPLGVGDAWEYETNGRAVIREEVVKDTVAFGRRYVVRTFRSVRGGESTGPGFRDVVRYDTASAEVRRLTQPSVSDDEAGYATPCPLDEPPGVSECQGGAWVHVDSADVLVFGGDQAGTGADTVRAVVKSFVTRGVFLDRFAAGVGLVYSGGEGGERGLTYYRVGGEERGVSRFPTSADATPPPAGASLAVAPNPTGGAATVRLDLPAPADVRVAVYDVLGRRVAPLASGPLTAGTHRFALDGAGWAPGVYVVRAEVGGAALARRVTVAR